MNKSTHAIQTILIALAVAAAGLPVNAQEAATSGIETNEPPKWDASASLGFSLTSGNSDTLLATAKAVGQRKFDNANLELGMLPDTHEGEGVLLKLLAGCREHGA